MVLDLGFGRGIGFYSRLIFELIVPTPAGGVEVCGGGRYDGLARVLGSDRDDRGAGFAFGLERLAQVLDARQQTWRPPAVRGYLVVADRASPGAVSEAVRVANLLRSRGTPAVLELDRPAEASADLARARGLARLLAVAAPGRLEKWVVHDLESGTISEVTLEGLIGSETKERRR